MAEITAENVISKRLAALTGIVAQINSNDNQAFRHAYHPKFARSRSSPPLKRYYSNPFILKVGIN